MYILWTSPVWIAFSVSWWCLFINFNIVHIITFFFHCECFFGLFRKSLPTPRSQRCSPMFSSKHSLFNLSHLEMGNWFFIWCEVGVKINFFPHCYPIDWAPFIEKTTSPSVLHYLPCDKSGNLYRWVFYTFKGYFLHFILHWYLSLAGRLIWVT